MNREIFTMPSAQDVPLDSVDAEEIEIQESVKGVRKLIREMLLQEAGSPTANAASQGLAVVVSGNPRSKANVLIYDPKILQRKIESIIAGPEEEPAKKALIARSVAETFNTDREPVVRAGVYILVPLRDDYMGRCYDSGVIKASLSWYKTGLGPAAYEAAMWYAGGLSSDRNEVSNKAKGVWKTYKSRADSGEIDALPFDNYENPKTPQPEDDCVVYGGGKRSPLNFSYRQKSKPPGLDELERNHQEFLRVLGDYGYPVETFPKLMEELFDSMWYSRMG